MGPQVQDRSQTRSPAGPLEDPAAPNGYRLAGPAHIRAAQGCDHERGADAGGVADREGEDRTAHRYFCPDSDRVISIVAAERSFLM